MTNNQKQPQERTMLEWLTRIATLERSSHANEVTKRLAKAARLKLSVSTNDQRLEGKQNSDARNPG